ncbi:MAG: DUF2277 domain-containing protein [Elusimicrobia bacterium]|nr:DUF2277 domain-containing protein [Elusimicrobiota bacterium]
MKTLRRPDSFATEEEVGAAASQFVRKTSGYRRPSQANEAAFHAAVDAITEASQTLLHSLKPAAPRAE